MRNHKILLVDDDTLVLETTGVALKNRGYNLQTAASGAEAIKLLETEPFDLVITDLVMDEVDGIEVLKKIKQTNTDTMTMIFTGYGNLSSAIEALRLDADDYMLKPCEFEDITFRIERCLEKLELKRKIKRSEEALRKSEQRFRTVADFTFDWEYWVAPDRTYLYVSPSCERITGYQAEAFARDPQLLRDIIDSRDLSAWETHESEAFKGDGAHSIDFRIHTQDGQKKWISHNCQPVFDDNGAYIGQRCSNRDISHRKIMEKEVLKARKFATIAVMTDGIAHDYNNLLSVVMGNMSLAQTYLKPTDKIHKLIGNAEKALMQIKDLTRQLFTFSENFTPVKKHIAIGPMLENLVMLFISGSKSQCQFDIDEDLWSVEIDRAQIGQVIRNLVMNAEDAMPDEGVIKVSARNKKITHDDPCGPPPGKYIEIAIEDSGVGIAPELMDRIFDPYFSTKEKGVKKGMGLGLAICHSVIKKHNGYLYAQSKPQQGSVFSFLLPASPRKVVKSGALRFPFFPTTPKISEKVLVMDDEEMIRDLSTEMLRRLGYDAISSDDGQKTINLYQEALQKDEPFDAVILDLTIKGGMGGIETMQKLLQIDPNVKAIVSTGYSVNKIMVDYKKYGFKGVVAKPYSLHKLHDVLSRILED